MILPVRWVKGQLLLNYDPAMTGRNAPTAVFGAQVAGRPAGTKACAEFRTLGRRSVGLRIRVIVVRPPERREVPAEVPFEVARKTVTDTTDLGTARLRTGQGQG